MEDSISWIDGLFAAIGGGVAWFTSKFEWWQNLESKAVKVGVLIGVFIAVALVLTVVNGIFT